MPSSTTDPTVASQMLPAWFVVPMMTDTRSYGMYMSSGGIFEIKRITAVHQAADDSIWFDVLLAESSANDVLGAPKSDWQASINAAHVVVAYEWVP
jgi:hypothetical protein